jgi:ABC-type branched-subunit amino acid transport system substrate-binding protein
MRGRHKSRGKVAVGIAVSLAIALSSSMALASGSKPSAKTKIEKTRKYSMGPKDFYLVTSTAQVTTSEAKATNQKAANAVVTQTVLSTNTDKSTKVITSKISEKSVTKKVDKTVTVTKEIVEVKTPLPAKKATGAPISIGWITDASSITKSTYYPEYEGAKIFFQALNDHGGINGRPVEILVEDMKIDQQLAVTAANKLLNEKNVIMLAGGTLESRLPAVFTVVRTAGAPFLTGHSARPDMFPTSPDPLLFTVGNVFEAMSDARVQLWPQLFGNEFPNGGTSACYIHEAPAALAVCNRWLEQLQKASPQWKPGVIAKAPLSTSDFTSFIRPIVNSNPTVFFDISIASHAIGVAVVARNLGYKGPIAFSMTATPETDIRIVANQVGGDKLYAVTNITSIYDYKVPEVKQVVAAATKYGVTIPASSATMNGWLMGMTIADSLNRCGATCDRAKLRNSLEKLSLDATGITGGVLAYSPTDHVGKRYWTGYKWDNAQNLLVRAIPGWIVFSPEDLLIPIK